MQGWVHELNRRKEGADKNLKIRWSRDTASLAACLAASTITPPHKYATECCCIPPYEETPAYTAAHRTIRADRPYGCLDLSTFIYLQIFAFFKKYIYKLSISGTLWTTTSWPRCSSLHNTPIYRPQIPNSPAIICSLHNLCFLQMVNHPMHFPLSLLPPIP